LCFAIYGVTAASSVGGTNSAAASLAVRGVPFMIQRMIPSWSVRFNAQFHL